MGLRKRTMLIFLLTIVLSSCISLILSRMFYLRGYSNLERIEAVEDCERVLAMLQDDIDQLDLLVQDWAVWDDTYRYMVSPGSDYEESNLCCSTFERLGLSSMVFLYPDGRTRFAYTAAEFSSDIMLDWLLPLVGERIPILTTGLLNDGRTLHIASARAILRNDESGPPAGLLTMTRPVDARLLERYSRLIGVGVTLSFSDHENLIELSRNSIRSSLPVFDMYGKKLAYISVDAPRTIYNYGLSTLSYYAGTVIVVMIVISLAAFIILETLVFRSIRSIGTQLERISSGVYPDARLYVPFGDEMGALAKVMNRTLDALHVRIRERETMLREIHHRVKNNLQIVASLLNLQASKSTDVKVASALTISRRRVLAMAIVHNELYDDPDLSFISLEELLRSFTVTYDSEGIRKNLVDLRLDSQEVYIDIDKAVPLGLILSEVLTNAYLHAFPDNRSGAIDITAKKQGSKGFILEILDNGIGIPPELDRKQGLGLSIIEALSGQLGASSTLNAIPGGGTLFVLDVPDEAEPAL